LTRYFNSAVGDHWVTTTLVPSAFATQSFLGYVFTQAYPGTTPLYDCYISAWGDHMVDVSANCGGNGVEMLRTLGWIWSAPHPNTVAAYRCYSTDGGAWHDHFVSLDPTCEGAHTDYTLGYIEQSAP
jgi:hypothetical protein